MAFSFMQTIFFIYLLVIHTCTTSSLTHDQECLALFDFKQSISPQPYTSFHVGGFQKLNSWRKIASNALDNDSDCCLWNGVACSNINGHVIGLDLSRSSLHGPIKSNSSLFNLVHLQMLNLSMNDFVESQIPSEIARLKQLRSLDLSNSSFSGQIPFEISHLMRLTLLDLSWNPLKLQSPSLSHLLQNLTRLKELHLSRVDISSFIPPFLANFSSLTSVDLQGCGLRDEFPSKIFHLPKLRFLSMAVNPVLTGSLPEFQNNTLLEHLDLSVTSFARSIPESICKLSHLVFLSLYDSYLSGCIPHSLSNMTHLTFLALGQNELMGLAPSFPSRLSNTVGLEVCEKGRMQDWIGKMTNLESLFLFRISIYGKILPSLANLTKLCTVQMTETLISGHIPSSFMNLTQLRVIDLSKNQLQEQIPSSFSKFRSLKTLNLQYNNFSGKLDQDTFLGLTKLRTLFLDYNRISFVATNNHINGSLLPELEDLGLSSCNLVEFPSFLRLQKKMSILLLRDNKIEGLVPDWILNNSQETLQILDLSHNSISGFHQHSHFLPWVRLKVFSIEYNQLQGGLPIPSLTMVIYIVSNNNLMGEIPPLICEVKSLQVLDLSSNNMTGILPPCLGNLSNVLVLDLKRNNFHGPMMITFTHGSSIKRIDLSENQFTGLLSKSLANCTNLEVIILGGNSFHDVFPFWLGTLSKLQVLIMGSNKFYGSFQNLTTVGSQFPKLHIIDLSNNGFSGQLPDKFFGTWNAMKSVDVGKSNNVILEILIDSSSTFIVPYSTTLTNKFAKREYNNHVLNIFTMIDLSCNNFEGQIPQSLSDLQGLGSLNLSNNHLTGQILLSFGNLKNLESLDLSRNKLSGEIPQELLQLSFLAIFNVSFNHLRGAIPHGKQFDTFDKNFYMGNPDLCGELLYKQCHGSKASTVPSTSNESEFIVSSDRTDFIITSLGVGSGLVIGIVIGNFLYARYDYWFIERFKLRKDRQIRPLGNKGKN